MDRRRQSLLRRNEQQRHTVGREHTQKDTVLAGDHAVGFARFFYLFVLDLNEIIAMHLLHGDNLAVVDAHRLLHIANVLADDLRDRRRPDRRH